MTHELCTICASRQWKPILDGDLARSAHATIDAIADALSTLPPEPVSPWTHNLSSGSAGRALFHAYRGRVRPDQGDDERAMELISVALDAAAAEPMDDSLFHGLAGLAWTVEHLGRHFYELGDVDPLARVDAYLISQVDHTRRKNGFELMTGLVGLGVYALARMPRTSARELAAAVVTALEASATTSDDGVAWFTPPEQLVAVELAFAPRGYYNVGVAHGAAGVIAFLARCVGAGVEETRARHLLDRAASWLLAHQQGGSQRFPAFVLPDETRPPMRAGWCYGDPGIACALELAGHLAGETTWTAAARATALAAAALPFDALGLADACLCHGACGTGHLFNRLYQASGEPALAAAARACFERGLAMRAPGVGIAGFRELDPDAAGGLRDSPGLLGGAAGIGLALIAAVSEYEPSWDAAFLVGVP